MDCPYKEKTILLYYGELPEAGREEVTAHAAACPSCAADLALLRGITGNLSGLRAVPPELAAVALPAVFRRPAFSFPVILRGALAGALTAAFLAAFHISGARTNSGVWQNGIDSGLEEIEGRIDTLTDEMTYPAAADFDYACSDLEARHADASGLI